MNVSLNQQLLRLTALLQLEQRARGALGRELEFLVVNETTAVVPYQQAVLWLPPRRLLGRRGITPRLVLSGVAEPEASAPYRTWVRSVVAAISRGTRAGELHSVATTELPGPLATAWSEWFPPHALWCPLIGPRGQTVGVLVLGRADPWTDAEGQVLAVLLGAYAQCLALAAVPRRRLQPTRAIRPATAIGIAAALAAPCLGVPVRQSVVAPAEVISINPAPIRAPFDGVVDKIDVAPNALVHAGDRLVTLDRTQLQARADVAEKTLEMARAEFEVSSQQAMDDRVAKAKLAILSGKVEQAAAELAYAKGLLARAELTAPIGGIAVFDGATEWIGKPVALGERIMQVASPTQVELEMQVPAVDTITFATGSEVLFFSNAEPDRPARASLDFASYASAPTPEGVMAYVFRARFDGDAGERLGLKGTAKIYGPKRPLAVWLLRRPIAAVRRWLAL